MSLATWEPALWQRVPLHLTLLLEKDTAALQHIQQVWTFLEGANALL